MKQISITLDLLVEDDFTVEHLIEYLRMGQESGRVKDFMFDADEFEDVEGFVGE